MFLFGPEWVGVANPPLAFRAMICGLQSRRVPEGAVGPGGPEWILLQKQMFP